MTTIFNHDELLPDNPLLMCIIGSSGKGKTHLLFNILTTEDMLDYERLYIYTPTVDQPYYKFLKELEFLPHKIVQDLFLDYKQSLLEYKQYLIRKKKKKNTTETPPVIEKIEDILKTAIKKFNPSQTPTGIEIIITSQKNDLNFSNIDPTKKNGVIFDDCVTQSDQSLQEEYFTKGRHCGCFVIYLSQSFFGLKGQFIRNNANCFILFEITDRDLVEINKSITHGIDNKKFKQDCKGTWGSSEFGYIYINLAVPLGKRVYANAFNPV